MVVKSVSKAKYLWEVIQGGMGVGVSNYKLARAVSCLGELGVVSGVALDTVMVRQLQNGDSTGEVRSALEYFPDKDIAEWIVDKYFIKNGKSRNARYLGSPFPKFEENSDGVLRLGNKNLEKLIVVANFVEVFLAKQGHDNPVGINYLHKIQWPLMPSIYGAMLAGVDVNLIGAGLPKEVSKVFNAFKEGDPGVMSIPVYNSDNKIENREIIFDPEEIISYDEELKVPFLLGIVSNNLGVRGLSEVKGYVLEKCDDELKIQVAGGHVTPARSKTLTEGGEPDYGINDCLDVGKLRGLFERRANESGEESMKPYWFAGGYAGKLKEARNKGAVGVQVGTPFALCQESKIRPELKQKILNKIMKGNPVVYTDPVVSPSGFPFQVFQDSDTLSCEEIYNSRERVCNLGYLTEIFGDREGNIGTRCSAERVRDYIRKGGRVEDTVGRGCLCNGLFATVGLESPGEKLIITTGSDFSVVRALVEGHGLHYTAKNVIDYILGKRD